MTVACPGCEGPWMVGHPCGPLTFQHALTCPHRAAEDAIQHADLTRCWRAFSRPATDTEKLLIAVVDPSTEGKPLHITVRRVAASIRSRTWT